MLSKASWKRKSFDDTEDQICFRAWKTFTKWRTLVRQNQPNTVVVEKETLKFFSGLPFEIILFFWMAHDSWNRRMHLKHILNWNNCTDSILCLNILLELIVCDCAYVINRIVNLIWVLLLSSCCALGAHTNVEQQVKISDSHIFFLWD